MRCGGGTWGASANGTGEKDTAEGEYTLTMAALTKGAKAPELRLPLLQGGEFEAVGDTDAVLVWFKVECPVCQYAMPYFERLWQRLSAAKLDVKFVGVSQNDANATLEFANRYGVTFPLALDAAPKYTASNAYGLTKDRKSVV